VNVAPNGGKAIWLLTDKLTVKLAGGDTGGTFALVEVVGQPDLGPPPHIHHRQDECFCIQDGTFEFTYEGKTFTAGPGSVVHLARGKVHSHKAVGVKPARALVIYTPAGLEHFLYEAGTPVTDPDVVPAVPAMPAIEKIVGIAAKHGIEVPQT